ncbi:Origin recognition complex subunit 2 [Bagarius yarrelli]|uniref:Origin recognition complex subunit 2 n=1 Tax=Bagarius yarrelli TaxID=175774 RepID=A0A556U0R4_BAGYA|nr:Origin recognition complex subunit 2 [Bagarius yarrelli]
MSLQKRAVEPGALEVRFVGDNDVLDHIVEKHEGSKAAKSSVQSLISLKSPGKPSAGPAEEEENEDVYFNEQHYVEALGTGTEDGDENGSATAGASVFTFQTIKRSNKMAQMASEWARTPGKSVTFSTPDSPEEPPSPAPASKTPNLKSDSDSDFSPSNSEEEEDEHEDEEEKKGKNEALPKTPSKTPTAGAALYKTPAKKSKKAPEPSLVEEYFEAHSSSKVLTSDRTLQKLQTPKLDRETLLRLLDGKPSCYTDEITQLNQKHERNFGKWMLQMGFNILLYGLGSKKSLLEKFRCMMLSNSMHLVVNGFFPSITLKSILNAITHEMLEHDGTFRTPMDQIDFIVNTLKKEPDNHIYLIIHNIDGPMLRGEKNQQALGQLAAIPNMHLLASIDHINAPLVWDHSKMCVFNWLWYETTTFLPYTEETSYENSLLVQQTGALALSSLTHVLRSLTPNARGIFRLLAEFQLENKDNPSYTGLSFQDFYQRCREAFLVNSDITLRTQLTEFRDHKLIRTKKGADGIEYLLIPVDAGTLTDFLEKEDAE